jgi:hypothetical protein
MYPTEQWRDFPGACVLCVYLPMSVWMSVYLAFQIRLWLFWIEPHFFLLKEAPFYDESTTTQTCDQDSHPVRHTSTTISRASPWGWGRQSPFSKQSTTQLPQLSQVMLLHLSKVSPSMIAHSLLLLTVGQHLRKKKKNQCSSKNENQSADPQPSPLQDGPCWPFPSISLYS